MELKGFITGSLVTLGVVGLVAALKEADFFDDYDSICMDDDDDAEEISQELQSEAGDSGTAERAEEKHGATSGTVNFNAETMVKTAKEIAAKLDNLKSAASDKEAEAMRAEIDELKESLSRLIESMEKGDAA